MVVTDDQGAAVPGAVVTALVDGDGRTATTNSSGIAALASYRGVPKGFCVTLEVTKVDSAPTRDGAVTPINPSTACQP